MTANAHENQLVRYRLEEVDDSGDQQRISAWGRIREMFGGKKTHVVRQQSYGFSSHPPKGSVGTALVQGGNRDQAFLFGPEHPDYRPKGLAEGESQIYNYHDNKRVYAKNDKLLVRTESHPIIIRAGAGGIVHINPDSE